MQTGSVTRHGRGWRGYWREGGKRHATKTFQRKGEARDALNRELERVRLGDSYLPPITLAELAERFIAQYGAAPQTVKYAERRLVRPLAALGDAQAGDVTTESLQRVLAAVPGKAYRRGHSPNRQDGVPLRRRESARRSNPALAVKAPMQRRSERMLPFESWDEVEAVAAECGRWGPLVVFMADTSARPGEAIRVEHRHVHPPTPSSSPDRRPKDRGGRST